ncbi:MAG: 3-keto-5-aminohexanoate cleavage protein [Acidimicrobiia bacterium]
MEHDAVIVEVGLNEATSRAANPHVPITPSECADDALRCRDSGAAIVHWHARDPDTGDQRLGDVDLYGAALDPIRTGGLLAYPSYPVDPSVPPSGRLDHVWALRARHGLELAPVDIGSVSVVLWDEAHHDFVGLEWLGDGAAVVDNGLPFVVDAIDRAYAMGMAPTLGAFDVGFTRTMTLLAEAGRLRTPVLHKIFLSGAWAVGPTPAAEALDLHLAQIPEGVDVEWVLVPYAIADPGLVERLSRHALERGGGIRVGVGDSPGAARGAMNASLVEQAVSWAAEAGRPVASSADVRNRFGLPVTAPAPR